MRGHTRKLPIEHSTQHIERTKEEDSMSADEMIRQICGDLPEWAVTLRGLRNREGLTQTALGNLLGIAQTNISKMELGKRSIGKTIAKRLAELFHTDYRLFL
jgi:DNA-binding XRE family transcriptional regulator